MAPGTRIAMWSGPRNISTAMMRSFGNRADTVVCDEPLYAHYLAATRKDHPGREEIIAHHERDWRRVAATLVGPIPQAKAIWYQKHMSHHLLPEVERDWLLALRNAFLVRSPDEMLASLARVLATPTLEDTGLPQQVELFDWLRARTGEVPPVVDARDVLTDPRAALTRLCAALGVPFDAAMLSWRPGPRATDGVWARHWYAAVERSTGFEPYRPRATDLPPELAPLLAQCEDLYARLYAHRLR